MNYKVVNHGFVEPVIEEDNYVFGGQQLTDEILMPGGQWSE